MKPLTVAALLVLAVAAPAISEPVISNGNFEAAVVNPRDPSCGWLPWNEAVPGWAHSDGSDTSIVYYWGEHLGISQYFLLFDAFSPTHDPGSQLQGNYSIAFGSGHYYSTNSGSPWVYAYLAQSITLPDDAEEVRLMATGNFSVLFGSNTIAMGSLGGNAYFGDIASFAGQSGELRIINNSTNIHDPVVLDSVRVFPGDIPKLDEIVIRSPTNGTVVYSPTNPVVQISAGSTNGIAQVQLFAGTNWVGTLTNAPYDFTWNYPLPYTAHSLTARVWDSLGNSATSPPVNVMVLSSLWNGFRMPDGTRWVPWFGRISDLGNGWVYHREHHWMYAVGTTPASIWLWTQDMDWLWTSSTVYPYLYRPNAAAWLWYLRDSVGPRWFYNFSAGQWESR